MPAAPAEPSTWSRKPRLGEARYRGPVMLAWAEVLEDGRIPGGRQNLVCHEFAHQLDMLDGVIDGTPPLDNRAQYRRWADIMTAEQARLRQRGRAAGRRCRTLRRDQRSRVLCRGDRRVFFRSADRNALRSIRSCMHCCRSSIDMTRPHGSSRHH